MVDEFWALSVFSCSTSVSSIMSRMVIPNENGAFGTKKSSSYLMWMFLMSYLIPRNNLVKSPRSGGSLNSYSTGACCFAFIDWALMPLMFLLLRLSEARIYYWISSSYFLLLAISSLILSLCFLRYILSFYFKAYSYYLSYFWTSWTIWAMIMMFLIWSWQS